MEKYNFVEHFDFEVNHSSLKDDAIIIFKRVKPEWNESFIKIKLFTDGITNRLIGGYFEDDMNNMILIRVYGEKTELFIDRNTEVRNIKMMHNAGLSPPLYCTFKNGVSYGYAPGEVLSESMVRDPIISRHISEMLAKMHTLRPLSKTRNHGNSIEQPEACLFRGMRKFLDLMPHDFNDPQQNDRFMKYIPRKKTLISEIESLEVQLKQLHSPVVFCHNDLLLKNIIYNRAKNSVTFIDFEYADYNYQAFDIGNHFCEFAGVDTYDPNLYPKKQFQMNWLKNYLESWHLLMKENGIENGISFECGPSESEVEVLYTQVNKFALAAHLYWGLWALIQAKHSSINFDFLGYSIQRLNEYYARRNELFDNQILTKDNQNGH